MAAPAPAPARAGGPCPLTQHRQQQRPERPSATRHPEGDSAQLVGSLELLGVRLDSCSAVPELALEGPQGRAPLPTASPNALGSAEPMSLRGSELQRPPAPARPAPAAALAEVTGADQSGVHLEQPQHPWQTPAAQGLTQRPCRAGEGAGQPRPQGGVVAVPLAPAAFPRQPLLSAASLQEEFCVTPQLGLEVESQRGSR